MENLLARITHVILRLYGILISGKNETEHLKNLDVVVKRLHNSGLRLKRNKCAFLAIEVVYCGHRFMAEGITPVKANVQAIIEAPKPENTNQWKSYLGMVN